MQTVYEKDSIQSEYKSAIPAEFSELVIFLYAQPFNFLPF